MIIGSDDYIGNQKYIENMIISINKSKADVVFPDFGVIKLRKDEILKLYSNIYKAKTKINWTPRVKFVRGLKKTISFYKKKLLI
jgi:nucleoside-diphosphate-sugar epimerase